MINSENVQKLYGDIGDRQVKVVAATKTVPFETINDLPNYNIFAAGENRVQELIKKHPFVSGIEWHFIGRLQTNKVKQIVDKVVMIQSLDRIELADEIEKRCAQRETVMDVLIEINSEKGKGGIPPEELNAFAEYVQALPHLRLKGIMCVPAVDAPAEYYAMLNRLHQELKQKYPQAEYLSVGMSGDYLMAIENGANLIRPGSMLFGNRQ